MTEVTLEDVTKQYGAEIAIEDISLTVEEGEILSVVGPSGCGKSTTLRTIAGFETPTEGQVLFDGDDVTAVAPEDRNVGLVFQDYALFENMTVLENVTFGPKMRGVGKEERIDRAEDLLELVGIEELADRKPSSLSGGQQQRVGLIRALAIEPEILLLDEPMTGLDAKLKKRLRRDIGHLLTELEVTALYVTHDQTQAMAMADRVAVLNDGRIEQVGTPDEVYESPTSEFVADFIGTSNLLHGVREDSRIDLGFSSIEFHEQPEVQGNVTLVARPEDLSIGGNSIRGTVLDTYYLGDSLQVLVEAPNGDEITLNLDPRDQSTNEIKVGEEVGLSIDTTNVHVIN